GTSRPVRPPCARNTRAKRNRANHPLLSGKRFDATEDRDLRPVSVRCSARYRGHASEFTLKRTCSRELKSHWHCLAIWSTAFERHSSRLVPVATCQDLCP